MVTPTFKYIYFLNGHSALQIFFDIVTQTYTFLTWSLQPTNINFFETVTQHYKSSVTLSLF